MEDPNGMAILVTIPIIGMVAFMDLEVFLFQDMLQKLSM
jgi:hypothetical protein